MNVTKFTHSCLLVEHDGHAALFDPGEFSKIDVATLPEIEMILVTHEHQDHTDPILIKQLRARFSDVPIYAPNAAVQLLTNMGLDHVSGEAPDGVRYFAAPHEIIRPLAEVDPPEQNGIHYRDAFTDPGDCQHFSETMPVLALPLTAPWGAVVGAVRIALELKPRYIIPVHEWHWRPEALSAMYDRLEQRFAEAGVTFLKMTDGQPVEIDL